jgi:two-component system, OmpR family, KDP operon response regulator KdpE
MEVLQDHTGRPPVYRDEHLFVDLGHARAILDSQPLSLTRKEYRLLALLVAHAGEVVPREILLTQLWGYVPKTRTRTLDVHIGRLRKKLGREGQRIETIFGKGYSFSPSRMVGLGGGSVEKNDEIRVLQEES